MASFSFPNNIAGLSLPNNADQLDNYSGEFVIEAWVYKSVNALAPMYSLQDFPSNARSKILLEPNSGLRTFWETLGGGIQMSQIYGWFGSFSLSSWHHIAASGTDTGSGVSLQLYIDGSRVGTGWFSTRVLYPDNIPYATTTIGLDHWNSDGTWQSSASYFGNGGGDSYMDQIRVTKGTNRGYSGESITIPTGPFTSDADTTVLVQASNWSGSGTSFTAAVGGTVSVVKYSGSDVDISGPDVNYSGGSSGSSGFFSLNSKYW